MREHLSDLNQLTDRKKDALVVELWEEIQKRKISGSTRSDLGRRCRDTFASLKKTCRKHGIAFCEYLKDRISGKNAILPLPELIRRAGQASA